ncbi:hypothetical protein [Streptomyces sp. NPDC057910]|uniref:hypothetical protein n=1 Tax=Streptomyces sp. NPDC057910 TaxID=3346278 RepID=UPI0036EE9A11
MLWWRRRSAASSLLDDLPIPSPFDLQAFCDLIAEARGRPLLLLPLDGPSLPELPCGIWLGLDVADLIFYEAAASEILRAQIVLHEIAHMLLGHTAPELNVKDGAGPEALAQASSYFEGMLSRVTGEAGTPDLPVAEILRAEAARIRTMATASEPLDELGISADRIVSLLGRTAFGSRQERDAESLATLILERASRRPEVETANADAADGLGRLNDAFGHPARVRKQ